MESFERSGDRYTLPDLVNIMKHLISDDGCPWDREQDHHTLRRYLIEESWEAVEAIENQNDQNLCEELGDVLLQIAFHVALAEQSGTFDLQDVVNGICRKMIRRHTHVFGEETADTVDEVGELWRRNKEKENRQEVAGSLEGDVPRHVPQTMRSAKLLKRAAGQGFEWPDRAEAIAKVVEESRECQAAKTRDEREEEVGDLLFAAVGVAHTMGVDPELALDGANSKFSERFDRMKAIMRNDQDTKELSPDDWRDLWNQSKKEKRAK